MTDQFGRMKQCSKTYYVVVFGDVAQQKIVSSAILVVQQKFIHCIATVSSVFVTKDNH